jgi:2-methylisocitrate lyase-like PEP mutase family enzyme
MTAGGQALRARLGAPGILLAPGVYDALSTLLAVEAGFEALYMTGYGVAASHGLPDAGLVSAERMAERLAAIVSRAGGRPVIADMDTGFGGLLNLRHALRAYAAAGAAAVQIEDQEFPKKCGHVTGRRVAPAAEMVRRLRVAAEARGDDTLLIVARTDARTALGLDEALRRAEAYARAGADILFVESPESEAELARIARALDIPVLANMVEGGRTPMVPAARLEAMGFRLAIHPGLLLRAAARATRAAARALRDTGLPPPAEGPQPDLHELFGLREALRFEARWLEDQEEEREA